MFSTAPALEKPELEKRYRSLITALVSAFGLGMDVIKALDCANQSTQLPSREK